MNPSEKLKDCVYERLRMYGITEKSVLLVAVSGGPDSVALLHMLQTLLAEGRIGALYAAHLHHGIRGEHADEDAAFISGLCREWRVPLIVSYADVPLLAREQKYTIEEAARNARYAFLRQARVDCGASHILTAHHMDDQAETVLLHLLRGSGLGGLCGMQEAAGELLRPLLFTEHSELVRYLEEYKLPFHIDETNADISFLRNKIRLELIPVLRDMYNPNIIQGLSSMAALLSEDEAYLTSLAQEALDTAALPEAGAYNRVQLIDLPLPVRSRALRLALAREGALYDMQRSGMKRLEALLSARTGAAMPLPHGLCAWVSYDTLHIGNFPEETSAAYEQLFLWPGETQTAGGRFVASYAGTLRKDEGADVAYMDADKLPADILVRPRRPGDMLYPLNAPGRRKLKRYLIDKKLPRERRMRPLLASGSEVLFFPGGTVSHTLRVTEETKRILRIVFEENKGG